MPQNKFNYLLQLMLNQGISLRFSYLLLKGRYPNTATTRQDINNLRY